MRIDLNCDMGEGFGPWRMGRDEEIMPYITSANVACGAHAGDPNVMTATIRLAKKHGVAVGAHPGFPDLIGFGRRSLAMDAEEVERWVLYQIGALAALAKADGVSITHVKAHGALYNSAALDPKLAAAIVRATRALSKEVYLFCPPGSEMDKQATEVGVKVVREGFADRGYEPNGLLMKRSLPGAVHTQPERGAEQAAQLAQGWVMCNDGSRLAMNVETICVHSDTPGAPEMIKAVRAKLDAIGLGVRSVGADAI